MKNFDKSTKQADSLIHSYETFLDEYNPDLRNVSSILNTPQPVVNFIVRCIDGILKSELNLFQGLADASKTKIKKKALTQIGKGVNSKIEEVETDVEAHKVQILDLAAGTGTLLAEVVKHIYKKFEGQQGIWNKYVANDLIPRLNGFEPNMENYAMSHLKLDMLLSETGYKSADDKHLRIFLDNALEEARFDTQTLFSSWLSDEAEQANSIKRHTPAMVVVGNLSCGMSSANESSWGEKLITDCKKDSYEKNIQPLSNDYTKIIRLGQHFIDKKGEGVMGYISNNSFIDGIMYSQMRKHLLGSFDKIYIIDLHGNSDEQEVSSNETSDQNAFQITQGLSISLFVKTQKKKKNEVGQVFYFDLYGKGQDKYDFLETKNIYSIEWNQLNPSEPNFFFSNKDSKLNGFPEYIITCIDDVEIEILESLKDEKHFEYNEVLDKLIDMKTENGFNMVTI